MFGKPSPPFLAAAVLVFIVSLAPTQAFSLTTDQLAAGISAPPASVSESLSLFTGFQAVAATSGHGGASSYGYCFINTADPDGTARHGWMLLMLAVLTVATGIMAVRVLKANRHKDKSCT